MRHLVQKFESDLMFCYEFGDGIAQSQKGTDGDDISADRLQVGVGSANS